ncbi:protein translocase subunit SecF [Candidatus Falkowbacteria bacterium]|uniref:Protein-export membrane protein SecF n=1 Tax=Candidatus Buchananbacteria bacterium CG10_big_fil_rev_8_21_14_0_10_33_19 TaxID=1974525 RepID=A0A2H0W3Y5_9BACT|nr:protein translocase subunit SecF [Candidatus Falkowbacteria bacterium]PIS06075.1 MAG: protein translocase subunit SecF [Candidatus Buchananbacteria bacterium CG10_big_fil_rev_8_21_14_0_10_33_19]
MKLNIIQNRKYSYIVSGTLILISILSLIAWGLKPGIDFTGGSLMELSFDGTRPDVAVIEESLTSLELGEIKIQPFGDNNNILRFKNVDEDTHQVILGKLKETFNGQNDSSLAIEERFESIGPVLGKELQDKAWVAIFLASMMIVLYIAYAFRKVSKPVESWKFGLAAIVALIHDILIVTGLFSILGHFAGIEVDSLFVTALLTILGFSVHDTIVVFDRTRENLSKHYSSNFEEVVNDSINQTISRSINTSLTTLLVLITLYLFGGATISSFILALIAGITVGTYSSIFVASPVLVTWYFWAKRLKS